MKIFQLFQNYCAFKGLKSLHCSEILLQFSKIGEQNGRVCVKTAEET